MHFLNTPRNDVLNIFVSGTGAMVAAVTTAAGRQPVVLGKPSKFMFEIVQRRHPSIQPARTLMIGDRFKSRIFFSPLPTFSYFPGRTLIFYLAKIVDFKHFWSAAVFTGRYIPNKHH